MRAITNTVFHRCPNAEVEKFSCRLPQAGRLSKCSSSRALLRKPVAGSNFQQTIRLEVERAEYLRPDHHLAPEHKVFAHEDGGSRLVTKIVHGHRLLPRPLPLQHLDRGRVPQDAHLHPHPGRAGHPRLLRVRTSVRLWSAQAVPLLLRTSHASS